MTQLAELYDGDKFKRRSDVERLRPLIRIPHPLIGVRYGDGRIPDNTFGKIHTAKPPYGGYKK